MEKLLELLNDLVPDVDFEKETALVDDELLTSADIIAIVAEIDDVFDIMLSPMEIVPENFNSAKALWNVIQKNME